MVEERSGDTAKYVIVIVIVMVLITMKIVL